MTSPSPDFAAHSFTAPADLDVFGFESTGATAHMIAHPRRWRVGGAVRIQALGLLAAPVVALLPPHAPWLLGALVGSFVLARKRWRHRFTLESVDGVCPKCGASISARRAMLRAPHPLSCDACHHEVSMRVDVESLDAHRSLTE